MTRAIRLLSYWLQVRVLPAEPVPTRTAGRRAIGREPERVANDIFQRDRSKWRPYHRVLCIRCACQARACHCYVSNRLGWSNKISIKRCGELVLLVSPAPKSRQRQQREIREPGRHAKRRPGSYNFAPLATNIDERTASVLEFLYAVRCNLFHGAQGV